MPAARGRTITAVAPAMADGELELHAGADREASRSALLAAARRRALDGGLPADAGYR